MIKRIGLIAGGGELPIIFAKKAREDGAKVIGFAIKGMASPGFGNACDKVHTLGIGEAKKFLLLLLTERVRKIVMLGKVDKSFIYKNNMKLDERAEKFLKYINAKNDYSILGKLTSEFKKVGVEVIDGIKYLSHLFPAKGVLTKRPPSGEERRDISFGFEIAKKIAGMDIGQAVVVKDGTVLAVEAMEGTDRAIERAGTLSSEGFAVVKVSRPGQDMRWDVPVIGPETIRLIAKYKGKALAIEEKKTFLLEKETCLKLADTNGISIVVV